MVGQAYLQWQSHIRVGRSSILIAADNDTVSMLNERAQADRVIQGLVDTEAAPLLADTLCAGRGGATSSRAATTAPLQTQRQLIRNGTLLDVVRAVKRDTLVASERSSHCTASL